MTTTTTPVLPDPATLEAPGASPAPGRRRGGLRDAGPLTYVLLTALLIFALGPIVLFFFNALKSPGEFASNPLGVPHVWEWSNFTSAWTEAAMGAGLLNSLIVVVGTVAITVVVAGSAAYALARLEIEFEIVVKLSHGGDGLDRFFPQGRAAQVRVDADSGAVDDRMNARPIERLDRPANYGNGIREFSDIRPSRLHFLAHRLDGLTHEIGDERLRQRREPALFFQRNEDFINCRDTAVGIGAFLAHSPEW